MRADLDRGLAEAVDGLLSKAAEYDGMDIIEANVELTSDLFGQLSRAQLAAGAAALALRLHRQGGTDG